MTMPYLPDPGFDGSVADRLKRRIFNAGLDPSAPSAVDLPIHTYDISPVSDQALRDIGNATVGVEPRPSFVQRLLGGLQTVARDPRTANVAAGLASVFRPTDTGMQGFLGSAADAFLNAHQYTDQRAVQQREQALRDRLMEAEIDNYRSQAQHRGEVGGGDPSYSLAGRLESGNFGILDRRKGQIIDTGEGAYVAPSTGHIDPLSPEGIARSAERARVVAQATSGATTDEPTNNSALLQARAFAKRAEEADANLPTTPVPSVTEYEVGRRSPTIAGQSQRYRQWYANALSFITPILRKESGAAISEQEIRDAFALYVPMPGDDPRTLAVKAAKRKSAIAGLRSSGNQSASPTDYAPPP